jgi:hypothetical protein
MGVPEDLEALELQMRQIQIEWEKFFGGVEKKPPTELKARVEALIRKHAYGEFRNATERFRYQGLTARYNTFAELWNKRLRAREEGKTFGVHGLKADILPPGPSSPKAPPQKPEFRVENPDGDDASVRALYQEFAEARKTTGEPPVKLENFQKIIAQQASRILAQRGAQAVSFRLEMKDGKVSLKARPVK